jgi:hypothetical protein
MWGVFMLIAGLSLMAPRIARAAPVIALYGVVAAVFMGLGILIFGCLGV